MKAKISLFLLPLTLLSLVGCSGDTTEKVSLDKGRLYDESALEHFDPITSDEFNTMVHNEESFMVLVYDNGSTCDCWHRFRTTLREFLENKDALLYALDYSEFEKLDDRHGITYYSDTETLAIFEEGELKYQRSRDGTEDNWANNLEAFTSWADERIAYSKLLEVNENQLSDLYEGSIDSEFTMYFGRESCGDCSYVNENFLIDYMKQSAKANLYYFDVDPIRDGESEDYDAFKVAYGLSESEGYDLGYGTGFVPTFQHVNTAAGTTEEILPKIDDMCVYFNDTLVADGDSYEVETSYYSQSRLEYLNFLNGYELEHKVLEGLSVPDEDVTISGKSIYWKNSAAAEYHTPILEQFLNVYIG